MLQAASQLGEALRYIPEVSLAEFTATCLFLTQVSLSRSFYGTVQDANKDCPPQTLRLINYSAGISSPFPSRPEVISNIETLVQRFRVFAVEPDNTHARYATLLSTTLDKAMLGLDVAPPLESHHRQHMLRQLPWFLLQKALWPMGASAP